MTEHYVEESKMKFGPFSVDKLFHIEKSKIYKNIQKGVPIAEFVYLRSADELLIIEAKSSAPQPKSQEDYDAYFREIHDKLVNAFSLLMASLLNRHADGLNEIPKPIKQIKLSTAKFRFLLVIHGHQDEWLIPLQESFNAMFNAFLKTWALTPTSIAVINDSLARIKNLIQ